MSLAALFVPLTVQAQDIATVNGRHVPKARVEALLQQARHSGKQVTPDMVAQARDQVVLQEIFGQEAEKRGIAKSPALAAQMELARQSILISGLMEDYLKQHPVTDGEVRDEYKRLNAEARKLNRTEYHASHILVEKEGEAKALIARIKAGAKFEDLARAYSRDPGSSQLGGDLGFRDAGDCIPGFCEAMTKLKKGEITEIPVHSQFGYHIIRLDELRTNSRDTAFDDVKGYLKQRLENAKLEQFKEDLRGRARTDYRFSAT